jgi:hypothetical protein
MIYLQTNVVLIETFATIITGQGNETMYGSKAVRRQNFKFISLTNFCKTSRQNVSYHLQFQKQNRHDKNELENSNSY